jgi:hypothetical protein
MAEGRLTYRAVNVLDATFRFRIKRLETEFIFSDGSVHTFTNWDIKGCRERFYMEEYVNAPVEEYLREAVTSGEIIEFGIRTSDIKRFIERKAEFFENLLFDAANNTSLDEENQ